jgi:hypothetical protein
MRFLSNKKNCLFKKERVMKNSRSSLHLKRVKLRSLTKNLLKVRRLHVVLRAQLVLLKVNMMSCKRHIKIFKCNLMLFGQAPLKHQVIPKLPKLLQAKVLKDGITLILMLFVIKANHPRLSKYL